MSIPKCSWGVPEQKEFHVFVGDRKMCECNYPEETPKLGQSICKHSNPDPLLCGACRLEQAVSQPHLTLETVDAQFCSDWLKDEIKRLFQENEALQKVVEYYAAPLNWRTRSGKVGITPLTDGRDSEMIDGQLTNGKFARKVLAIFKTKAENS